jgi:hypothetical protein
MTTPSGKGATDDGAPNDDGGGKQPPNDDRTPATSRATANATGITPVQHQIKNRSHNHIETDEIMTTPVKLGVQPNESYPKRSTPGQTTLSSSS